MHYRGNDRTRLDRAAALARETHVPLIAVNDVLYHHPDRRELQDVLTCIREHTTIEAAGRLLAVNAERHFKPPQEMARLFRHAPEAIEETIKLSDALAFSLDEFKYEYPDETRAGFASPQEALEHFTYAGAARRYPAGIPDKVRATLQHELAFIASLNYAPYFLTVHDIVRYARSQGILCQGRGSAANSSVCFCLGITEVDPSTHDLLFERFISSERREPPDIDVDFEHERREEVIQYIYRRYGRDRTGIAATVICYRGRSAIREVGKVFGLSEDTIGMLSSSIWGGGGGEVRQAELTRAGIDIEAPRVRKMRALVEEIQSFPRHLSQHVGGFVMTRSRLDEVVPIGNAAMEDRTFVEWDKDDLDALGILKVDVLGLGMLTCIRKSLELLERHYGVSFRQPVPISPLPDGERACPRAPTRGSARVSAPGEGEPSHRTSTCPLTPSLSPLGIGSLAERALHSIDGFALSLIPAEDHAVYRMIQRADTIGVFQIESRAQMTMLPRLRPEKFYDLVIEVAIVRPGPIQGDMVHPYLRRRQGLEEPEYPSPRFGPPDELRQVLQKTLGVPLFQEQAMKIAIVAGGFTPGEADQLRRAMATFKRVGTIGTFRDKMIAGMVRKGYEREFAERCFRQIEGFGEYGFPESHAASFALLVYASAWIKCHYPDVFAAALLNAQPMGFYAPAQIVRDVREHGVEMRPVDVNHSDYDATLEDGPSAAARLHELHVDMADDLRSTHAIRLGLREIKGLSENDARLIVARRTASTCTGELTSPRSRGESLPSGSYPRVAAHSASGEVAVPKAERAENAPHPNPLPASGERGATIGYDSIRDLWLRTGLSPRVIEKLADADAFGSLGLSRRDALWAVKALGRAGDKDDLPLFCAHDQSPPPLRGRSTRAARREGGEMERAAHTENAAQAATPLPDPPPQRGREQRAASSDGFCEPDIALPPMPLGEEVVNDYRFLHLSLRAHPASFLRADLDRRAIVANERLRRLASGTRVTVSGLITCRQRPGSANGVIFMTIEDETALANIIVWPKTFERFRPIVLGARYIVVHGKLQQESGVIHVVADRLDDLTFLLSRLADSHGLRDEALARCDEVRRPVNELREQRLTPGRKSALQHLLAEMPDLAADLDVPARGSAHAPTRQARAAARGKA
jgi:error-prone DNA polymerase